MKQLSAFFFIFFFPIITLAQVTIAPTNLFIDAGERFGTYMVINGSNQNQEISIDFLFGYSKTDENGFRSNIYSDSIAAEKYSIASSVRAFPQNFVIAPGTRQIVRLRINEPENLSNGTYWARIRTTTIPESPPVEVTNPDNVVARIGINIEQLTGLFYKKGTTTTGIEIDDIRSFIDDNTLVTLTTLRRTGNSPFLGSIKASLIDNNQTVLKENSVSTSIYFDGTHRHEIDISDIKSGVYTINVSFETRRSDISRDNLVQMQPVSATTTVTIP